MEQIGETEKELRKIKEEIINCQKCPLFKTRIYPVVGEGNHKAKIIFIGEAPGANEDRTGRPFCGRAGEVLDKLLAGIGIRREDVYICNLLKCRPPGNRDPKPEEIEACSPYLMRQIKLINPQVICPLGRYSMKFLMEKFGLKNAIGPITKIHGKLFPVRTLFGEQKIIPLYHPAVVTYNINMMSVLEQDFRVLKEFM